MTGWGIAIVSMAARLPGGPLASFFDRLLRGEDASRDVPEGRWLAEARDVVGSGDYALDQVPHTRGYFLDEYDHPTETAGLDPVFGLTLGTVREAWLHLQNPQVDSGRVGLILGNLALPSSHSSRSTHAYVGACLAEQVFRQAWNESPTPPADMDPAGNPVRLAAKVMGFGGPTLAIDAACASSLYALALAARALLDGRADAMLAGGVARPDPLYTQMGFTQLRALAPDGRCRPFDAEGRGLIVGEGAGIFVLKRLADAVQHGDQILGVIQGIGLANDLDGSLMAPSREGQLRAMRAAYQTAGWCPTDVDVIECHATGTPVGDRVEAESLIALWRDQQAVAGQCVLGSVKANVGHMLTAAGASGLIKILLAMQHGQIPPTANYQQHSSDLPFADSPFTILQAARPWLRRCPQTPRRAAISGFGFGGINAHLLVEEYRHATQMRPALTTPVRRQRARRQVAIVGIDVACRGIRGFDAWRQMRRHGKLPAVGAPRWWGAENTGSLQNTLTPETIEAVLQRLSPLEDPDVPLSRFRFPPVEWREMLPQQAWMLLVAAAASQHGNLLNGSEPHRRGVAIGLGLDGLANVFSLRWRLTKQVTAWQTSLAAIRQSLGHELTYGRVLGALGSLVASRVARELHCGGFGIAIAHGQQSGFDALATLVRAIADDELDTGIAGACDLPTLLPTYLAATMQRRQGGDLEPTRTADAAVAFVLKDAQLARTQGDRIYAWVDTEADDKIVLSNENEQLSLTTTSELNAGAATSMLTALDALAMLTDKYTASGQYWLRNRSEGQRCLTLSSSLRLIEPSPREAIETRPMAKLGGRELLLLAAETRQDLAQQLQDPFSHAISAPRWQRDASPWPFRISLLAETDRPDLLASRLTAARRWLSSFDAINDSPVAHFYCAEGIACGASRRRARTALMYPGSGSWYPGMGRDLAAAFPAYAEEQDRSLSRYAEIWGDGGFWRQTPHMPSPAAVISAQCAVGILATQILLHAGFTADAACGYSLGESAALLALGIWSERDRLFERLVASPIFTTELVGPMRALRRHWQLPNGAEVSWAAGLVRRGPDEIRTALQGIERVYLLNVNTPKECVIAGDPLSVAALYQRLDHPPLPLTSIPALHCSVVREVEAEFRAFHTLPVTEPRHLGARFRFYSCARGEPVALESQALADSVLAHAISGVNWPRLVDRLVRDGIEFLLEPGPGATLGRMVSGCLADAKVKTMAICSADGDEVTNLFAALMAAHALGHPITPQALQGINDRGRDPQAQACSTRDHRINSVPETPTQRISAYACAPFITANQVTPKTVATNLNLQNTHRPTPQNPKHGLISSGQNHDVSEERMRWQAETILRFASLQSAEIRAQATFLELQTQFATNLQALVTSSNNYSTTSTQRPSKAWLDLDACREFARGSIGKVLGPEFAAIDQHPTRVRLPDGPLLLCHRMMSIEATPLSMTHGTLVTEHDVTHDAWYLDGGRIPTCVAVEAGQADLFLAAYLGADFHTKGLAVYRLLDATVIFHGRLPEPGQTIRYVIHIDHFFRQGETLLFRFGFDATVDGHPLITMRDGCAGFFTATELAAGKGIVRTGLQEKPAPGKVTGGFSRPVAMHCESLDDQQLDALRQGDYVRAFDWSFADLALTQPKALPGGMLRLVHRIPALEPNGGRWGLGRIVGEADIHPDDWFLTCHFVDDMVMPGTLMYECCMHTLRVFLMRMGWVGEDSEIACEPIPGIKSRLKCRGQVLPSTNKVRYEIELKEIGYGPDAYALADATMYADERPIVEISDMSIRHQGLTKERVEQLWHSRPRHRFGKDSILALAEGKVSEAFGPAFIRFDHPGQRIARLPRAPYGFLDRVDATGADPFVMRAGGSLCAEYNVPADAWYFAANHGRMPFAVLNEIALQACGFYSAYMGAALTSDADLYYRNLSGSACLHQSLGPDTGRLTTHVKCTKVASTGDMILHEFAFTLSNSVGPVYSGTTSFGFFTASALAKQVGLRADLPQNTRPLSLPYPERPFLPRSPLLMIDTITELDLTRGLIRGQKHIDPNEWFFAAHFHQDPVMPGSLGLEAMAQLLQVYASEVWPGTPCESLATDCQHEWIYRGQVLASAKVIEVMVNIVDQDHGVNILQGDGLLLVDGLAIYRMQGLAVRRLENRSLEYLSKECP